MGAMYDSNPSLVRALQIVMCAGLVAEPGAAPQIWHMDSANEVNDAVLLQVFVLVSDVSADMGPLEVCPQSHWHAFTQPWRDDEWQHRVECFQLTGKAGTVIVMDSRVKHRGGRNYSYKSRPVLQFTIAKGPNGVQLPDGYHYTVHPQEAWEIRPVDQF